MSVMLLVKTQPLPLAALMNRIVSFECEYGADGLSVAIRAGAPLLSIITTFLSIV